MVRAARKKIRISTRIPDDPIIFRGEFATVNSTLQEKKDWTVRAFGEMADKYEEFREVVFELCDSDPEYKLWVQTTKQTELAKLWNIKQSQVSRYFAPIQNEFKAIAKAAIMADLDSGMSCSKVAKEHGVGIRKVQLMAKGDEKVKPTDPTELRIEEIIEGKSKRQLAQQIMFLQDMK